MATPFVRWKQAVETMPAVINAASSEADAKGGDGKSEATQEIAWDEWVFAVKGGGGGG